MRVAQLVDTFDAANPALTYSSPAARVGGRLSLPFVAPYHDPSTGLDRSLASVSASGLVFTNSSVVLELVTIPTNAVRAEVSLTLSAEDADIAGAFLSWRVLHGVISATRYVDQVETTGWSAPFDPIAHRWIKMRHEPGAVFWSTSVDGLSWVDRAVLSTSMVVDPMHLGISSWLRPLANPDDDDGITPPPALVDNLNNPPVEVTNYRTEIAGTEVPNIAVDLSIVGHEGDTLVLDDDRLDEGLLGWGDNPAGWVNLVCDGVQVQIERGITSEIGPLDQTEAGTASIVLRDLERRVDPTINGDIVHPGTPVRVRAWGGTDPALPEWSSVLFTGRVSGDGISVAYAQTGPPIVTFTATDIVGDLNRWESAGHDAPGVGTGDTLLTRINRVIGETGIGAVAVGSDPTYLATLAPTLLDKPWEAILDAATAELGRVWVTAGNQLAVRARGSQLSGPVRGTLSDWHGETTDDTTTHCCYLDPLVRYSPAQLANRVIGNRNGSATPPVRLDDEVSQVRHGVHTASETSLALADDAQVAPWARALITGQTEVHVRLEEITPTPRDAEAWQAVCATDIGDRWHFRFHPELGPTVAQAAGVLGITHDITPAGWVTKWRTAWAPAPGQNPTGWFLLDLSELDGGDLLSPFG